MNKRNKGVTLIALAVTIIVMLILAGVTISALTGESGIIAQAKKAKEASEKAKNEEKNNLANMDAIMDAIMENGEQSLFGRGINKPQLSDGMIPVKYNGTNWVICDEDDEEWYDYENKKWANIMLSDGTYKQGINAEKETIVQDTELGSMFVWIPRFAYSINKYKTQVGSASSGEGTTQEITNVSFLVGKTNRDINGNSYGRDYDVSETQVGSATEKIVHPAFEFGGEQLAGIWSAKFEASMAESNNNTVTNNNTTNKTLKIVPNAESWRYIQVGNCFQNCYNMNKTNNIYGIISSTDSHLMKNNEWGAIAYLATSEYGVTPTKNDSYIEYSENGVKRYHSYSGGKGRTEGGNYKANKQQSTTGNETGIYDLNGGAWEYVAAYWDNGNGNLSGQGTNTIFANNKLKAEYEKYWNRYEVSETEKKVMKEGLWNKDNTANNIRKNITDDRYNLMRNIKGDAMYEVINTYSYYGKKTDNSYEWGMDESYSNAQYGRTFYNDDFALIGNCSRPFLLRGGAWWDGTGAGVFAALGYYGNTDIYIGFRPVLVVQ